jgi:putative phosphoribosyl transferase
MSHSPAGTTEEERRVEVAGGVLIGDLIRPPDAVGLIVFAHGSGSSRSSPRNRYVADLLHQQGFATFLVDLLTVDEDRHRSARFDIDVLAGRLTATIDHLLSDPAIELPIGVFGASTGAAAAIVTAATRPGAVRAVVSRGGRPDLAGAALTSVRSPTLLIVGDNDPQVLDLNRVALRELGPGSALEVIPGASHLFEEPGALDSVARRAARWFQRHLQASE